jgi:hypothetical protein
LWKLWLKQNKTKFKNQDHESIIKGNN